MAVGATPFIDDKTSVDAYEESKKWLRLYFEPLDEYERLERNKPSSLIPPELPKVTDGTLASILRDQPKRVIQQLDTGMMECMDYPALAKIADLVLTKKLLPMYNREGDALQKAWNMLRKAGTWGSAVSYTFFTSTDGEMHSDFVIPYRKDVLTEKGKLYGPDSNVAFLRAWYTRRDLKAIIEKEKLLTEKNPGYKSGWDLGKLSDFIESGASQKPADQMNASEREKGGESGGYEVIHAFQKGQGAISYSFAPRFNNGLPLRTKINNDPRGNIPLDFLYYEIDLSNPLGRGFAEIGGALQNLIDAKTQLYQYMSYLEVGAPLQVWGTVNKASLKMRPNAIWDMGTSPTNKVEPYAPSTFGMQNFTNDIQFLQAKLYALAGGSNDNSISAENNNFGQSRTPAGVKDNAQTRNFGDNYLRKQYEAWGAAQKETAVNIYFAEMKGSGELRLEGDDLKELRESEVANLISEDGVLNIPYSEIEKVVFRFKNNPSSSEVKEDADNAEKLSAVYEKMLPDPDPEVQSAKKKVLKAWVDEIGAEGTDGLFPSLETGKDGQPMADAQPAQQQMTPEMVMQLVQQGIEQAMQQGDMADKQAQNDLKAQELQLKAQQMDRDHEIKQGDLLIKAHDSIVRGHDPEPDDIEQAQKMQQLVHADETHKRDMKAPIDKPQPAKKKVAA